MLPFVKVLSNMNSLTKLLITTLLMVLFIPLISGCSNHTAERLLNIGPYALCRDNDTCPQAGGNIGYGHKQAHPNAVHQITAWGRACWAESNRANWDQCR